MLGTRNHKVEVGHTQTYTHTHVHTYTH